MPTSTSGDQLKRFAIAVGGNRGDVAATAEFAEGLLAADGIVITARSRWHQTPAVGGPFGQSPFLNAAWLAATALGPHSLLAALQRAETACGRARSVRWGPRTLDLDLVLAEDGMVVDSAVLTLPHPRLHLRRFVLEPLCEVAPGWRHPRFSCRVDELPWPGATSA